MSHVQPQNYISIQGWMRTELDLKGNDLMVYAIIYGFSQTEGQWFTGSRSYLADWCGATRQGIDKNLKNLMDMGLIEKEPKTINGVNYVAYRTTEFTGGDNSVDRGTQLSCHNNIDNKLENTIDINISKDISEAEESETSHSIRQGLFELSEYEQHMFSEDVQKRRRVSTEDKPKRLNLFDKCMLAIAESDFDDTVKDALRDYLPVRLAMKDKPMYGLNQWKGMLNKLAKMSNQAQVVRMATERGWGGFFDGELQRQRGGKPNPSTFGETEEHRVQKVKKEERVNGYLTGEKF